MVRMKVARSEFTFSTPTLAKIAVRAANTAERTAQNCQANDHDENALTFMASCLSPIRYPTANLIAKISARTSTTGVASAYLPEISFDSA